MSNVEFHQIPDFAPARDCGFGAKPETVAAGELYARISDNASHKALLFGYLRDGLLRAFASKAYFAAHWTSEEKPWRNPIEVTSAIRYHGDGELGAYNWTSGIEPRFWHLAHCENTKAWKGVTFAFNTAVYSDWIAGRFEAIFVNYGQREINGEISDQEQVTLARFFGVSFAADDVAALFPVRPPEKPKNLRATKHNWEPALSAFNAAQWKHDVVPDIHAYGALAKIEDWFSNWFSANGESPSEGTVRARAQMVLDDMKRADKG
jgi:hypothetical protein